ncbi:MAG: hypothetical protein UT08_C0011G0014 [Candidatus Woesebacteria bacterium GW2011_GWB1_38_8]|uniref:Predicted DNA-binding protein ribbon-helix-helix domain-containing protein n=2 Tax=Candidatus Woeseibacteriota TaxID=1752722 RepID=A0A0G0P6P9_9BACT|nr:MAG: hypothetical protein UT08_C0011G0014 [Candidatus Woesebacteria bacterium GW2011_GWB1_38_8]OGM20486.1 MAG: hypothetical protein A2863_01485 [Candidatus Woesebacteria bacterium RIFCSPHIGHO2_01_FULL_38_9b]
MIRTQVYLPDELYRELKLLAASGKYKFSELLREGVEEVIRKKKKKAKGKHDPWKDFIGAIKGVKTDAVKDIDDYYKTGVVK